MPVTWYRESDALDVHKAQYHKEVPGVEDMEPYWNLEVRLGPHREKVLVDSVLFKGAWKVPRSWRKGGGSILKVQVEESEIGTGVKGAVDVQDDEALIYYTIKNKKLYKHVTNIKQNETIYLP